MIYVYMILVCWVVLLGAVGFFVVAYDKLAAVKKWWRVPERALHRMEWMGGIFGMCVGMFLFWHKVSKGGYWHKSVLPFVVWCVVLGVVYWSIGW